VLGLLAISGGALSASAATDPYAYPDEQPVGGTDAICTDDVEFSYVWDGPSGTGSVIVTGGDFEAQPLCTPLFVRATSYSYDTPVDGNTPSWPQTLVGYNDYTVDRVGTFDFQVPGTACGQDDVYATFDYSGFGALEVSPFLNGPSSPFEPDFLHQAVPTGTGGYTIYHDDSALCGGGQLGSAQLDTVKRASAETVTVGEQFDYTLQVSNTGTSDAGAIIVTDMLPANVVLDGSIDAGDWSVAQSTDPATGRILLTFERPSLAAGATADLITVPVVVTVASTGTVENTATACVDDSQSSIPCVSDTTIVGVQGVIFTATPICVKDVPAANYNIQLLNVDTATNPDVIFEWVTLGGDVVQTVVVPTAEVMSGTLTWPGATFDSNGNATDWPGWTFNGTQWVQDTTDLGANLRPAAVLSATIAGVQTVQMDYPGGPCANPVLAGSVGPGNVDQGGQPGAGGVAGGVLGGQLGGQQLGALAVTGAEQEAPFTAALALIGFGAAFVIAGAIRRKRVAANA